MPRTHRLSAETLALIGSLCLLVTIVVGLVSCGDQDIFFPGELLPTNTAEPTSTNTPDDN